jgi:hypothetical protein
MAPVIHAIREPSNNCFTNIAQHYGVHARICRDAIKHSLDTGKEINPQSRLPRLVIIERRVEFGLGFVAKNDREAH